MNELWNIFPLHLRDFVKKSFEQPRHPEEIRIRVGQPLVLDTGVQELLWDKRTGRLLEAPEWAYNAPEWAYRATEQDVQELVTYMSNYSLYAFEEEVRAGFLTIRGGHRIGIAGKAVCENGQIKTIRQISFLNIRIAGEQKGCASGILPWIRQGESIYNTLIISPPGAGKTTLLRDCIRQLSKGNEGHPGVKIGIVDERSEIAACYLGIPQNDVGPRTDVIDCCPKALGMSLLLRSMSPRVIGVDELGGQTDYEAVEYALHCGCRLIGTIHGCNPEEMKQKPHLARWLEEGFFERYIVIEKREEKQRIFTVYNERLEQIC